jgi:putative acetyltransferase
MLAAFSDPQIPPLIAAIRASQNYIPALALVADVAGAPGRRTVVGHVMVSSLDLVTSATRRVPVLALSPLGVDPSVQNRGIGGALTRAVLAAAEGRPEPLMIVQGHPDYYPRFGFRRGRALGILPPKHLGNIDRAWMARPGPSWRAGLEGRIDYPSYFLELD